MTTARDLFTLLGRTLQALSAGGGASPPASAAPAARRGDPTAEEVSPGRDGPSATVEVDPADLGEVRLDYSPRRDGDPDPGEIVWTWVPYQERDGRGKDRPVAIVANVDGDFLAVQLTSKGDDRDVVPLGVGPWDAQGRPSFARIDRVFRVRTGGMRREAAALDPPRFRLVAAALADRYGWR